MGNARIVTTLLLVFLAGAGAGMLSMHYGLHEKLHRTVVAASPSRETNREVLDNFKTKLDLSSEQTGKIALVLQDYGHYYESLQDQLDDLRATGRTRILQILDPGQRDKFEKMMADLAPQLTPASAPKNQR